MDKKETTSIAEAFARKWETETPIWKKEVFEVLGHALWETKKINDKLISLTLYDLDSPKELKPFFDNANRIFDFKPNTITHTFQGQMIENSSDLGPEIITLLEQTTVRIFTEIWISPYGTQLFSAVRETIKKALSHPAIFIETASGKDKAKGNTQQLMIIPPQVYDGGYIENGLQFVRQLAPFYAIFSSIYQIKDLEQVKSRLSGSYGFGGGDIIPSWLSYLVNSGVNITENHLIPLILSIKEPLKKTLRITENAWKNSATLQQRHAFLGSIIDTLANFTFPSLTPFIDLLEELIDPWEAIEPDTDAIWYSFHSAIEQLLKLCRDLFAFADTLYLKMRKAIQQIKNDLNDMTDSLISYCCGFWNGLVDALEGVFDTAVLIGSIVLFFLKSVNGRTVKFLSEFVEEVREMGVFNFLSNALESMGKTMTSFHTMLVDGLYTLLVKMEEGDIPIDNPRVMSYYFGYTVYNIIENFLPPLKITSKAKYLLKPLLKTI